MARDGEFPLSSANGPWAGEGLPAGLHPRQVKQELFGDEGPIRDHDYDRFFPVTLAI